MFSEAFRAVFYFGLTSSVLAKSIQNATSFENKVEMLEKSMETIETRLSNMSDFITNIEKDLKQENMKPYFYVELGSDTTLHYNSIVKFDIKVIDEGNNFNNGDGIFVAPKSGLYLFAWTMQAYRGNNIFIELRVDNVIKGRHLVIPLSSAGEFSTSRHVLCNVQKGNHVWIQTGPHYSANFFQNWNSARSSFMGFLLKEK